MPLGPEVETTSRPSSQSPFASGLLSAEAGQALLQTYTFKMMARFPFVVISERSVDELQVKQPALCLAVMTVAAFDNGALRQRLGHMFSDLVAERITRGKFASLDLLQALLVQLAWYMLTLYFCIAKWLTQRAGRIISHARCGTHSI